jgi:hypothetical protein
MFSFEFNFRSITALFRFICTIYFLGDSEGSFWPADELGAGVGIIPLVSMRLIIGDGVGT